MKRTLLAALVTLAISSLALAGGAPSETVVLVNTRSADSVRVAEHYVRARHIPTTNVCRVDCDTKLSVKREEFVEDVVEPLRAHLRDRGIEDRARFVVLTQGMPIRATGDGGSVSTAAMLELLDTPVCGAPGARLPRYRNPYTSGVAPVPAKSSAQRLYLVTALISSTADEAMALVDRSVAADGTAPEKALFVYQDANGNAGNRNPHYDAARKELEKVGHATEHVKSGADVVTERKRVMGYMSGGSYSKLTPQNVRTNEYLPGALCDMLQSFGAVPENFGPDGKGGKQFPVTHMVRAGITGVHGAVAEPYNIAFPTADLFTPYVQGYTLAETFHQKQPYRYWMNLVLGDPLCAPYAERLAFDVGISQAKEWRRSGMIGVTAPGAVRIEAFLDGVSLGAVDGAEASYALDARDQRAGAHTLLVEVVGPGAHEPRSWQAHELTFVTTDPARTVARPDRLAIGAKLVVPLTSVPKDHAFEILVNGKALPHSAALERGDLVVTPDWSGAASIAGAEAIARLTLDGTEMEWPVRIGPSRLIVEAPKDIEAGRTGSLRVTAVGADDRPVTGWRDTVLLRTPRPPVQWARADLGEDGTATLSFASALAARYDLVPALASGIAAESTAIDVLAGAPHHATTPLSRIPLGQCTDIPIRFEDRFGNPVSGEERTVTVSFPDDAHARVPGRLVIPAGAASGVLRDVVVSKSGRQRLVIKDAGGKTWSQPAESVDARLDAVRSWLTTRAYAAAEGASMFEGDPSAGVNVAGDVVEGRLFRRLRATSGTISLPTTGSKTGDVACAVAFVDALADTTAKLRIAAPGRVRVLVDGKSVFDGVPQQTNPRKPGKDEADVTLEKGRHLVTVIAERKGRFQFRLDLASGKDALARSLRIRPDSGRESPIRTVSGSLVRGRTAPVSGATVIVKDGSGVEHRATTERDGSWSVSGVADGEATVRVAPVEGASAPQPMTVEIEGAHVTDLTLRLRDDHAPKVTVADAPAKAGRTLRLTPRVADAGGVAEVWVEAGGKRLGAPLRRAPWRFEIDVSTHPRGKLSVVVAARDASGNVGRSSPIAVDLVSDEKGPKISLKGLNRNATLKKPTEVQATVSDPIGVAEVSFQIDGTAVGAPSAKAPYVIKLDPTTLGAGRHVLTCIARDADGNESRKELSFRVKETKKK